MIKKISAVLLLWSFCAQAGLPPTTIKGQSDPSPVTTFNLQVPNNQITRLGGVNALIETGNANTLVNPNASGGTAGYAASGGTFTTGGTGNATYFSWDSNAAAQTVASGYQTVTAGDPWSGQNGVISATLKCATGTCTHKLQVYDGTTVLAEKLITTNTTAFMRTSVNFVYPSSGTIRWQLVSVASNEPALLWRGGYRGLAEGFNLSQATGLAGGPWIDFTPVIGNSGTTWNIGAPTQYRQVGDSMQLRGYIYSSSSGSGGPTPPVTIGIPSPYTINLAKAGDLSGTAEIYNINGGVTSSFNVTGVSAYDSTSVAMNNPGTGAYIHGSDLGNPAQIHFNFEVPIVGWAAQVNGLNYIADQYAASWGGTSTLSGVTTSTTLTDPTSITGAITQTTSTNLTCTAASSLLGITCALPKVGRYQVCYGGWVSNDATPQNTQALLADGSNNVIAGIQRADSAYPNATGSIGQCGIYNAGSVGSATFKLRGLVSNSTGTFTVTSFSVNQLDAGQALPYFVTSGGGGSSAWGGITGTLSAQTDLQSALNLKQDRLRVTRTVTTTGTLLSTDDFVFVNAAGATTQTLPSAATAGQMMVIKNLGAGTPTVSSTDLIDGATTLTLTTGSSISLISAGGTWNIW